MESLAQIGRRHGTDQETTHDYCRTMEEFLSPRRHLPVVIVEQGVLGAAGIRMWASYFDHPDSRIIGLDPNTFDYQPITDPRVRIFQGSQTDQLLMREIVTRFGPLDLLVDDAGHFASAQQESFRISWPFIKPGGFYCIQDLHSYAAPELCDAKENVMEWLTRIATEMQGRGAQASGKVEPTDQWAELDTVTFRKGLAVLRKMGPQKA